MHMFYIKINTKNNSFKKINVKIIIQSIKLNQRGFYFYANNFFNYSKRDFVWDNDSSAEVSFLPFPFDLAIDFFFFSNFVQCFFILVTLLVLFKTGLRTCALTPGRVLIHFMSSIKVGYFLTFSYPLFNADSTYNLVILYLNCLSSYCSNFSLIF